MRFPRGLAEKMLGEVPDSSGEIPKGSRFFLKGHKHLIFMA